MTSADLEAVNTLAHPTVAPKAGSGAEVEEGA